MSSRLPRMAAAGTVGLYADAEVYDILHDARNGRESLAEARLLVRLARAHRAGTGRESLRCYEPACGSGRVLVALARLGHFARGTDLDAGMVRFANQRLRTLGLASLARASVGRMEEHPTGVRANSIDLALNPINTIRHLGSDAAMVRHLRTVRALLSPGGVYIVGLSLSLYGHEHESEDVWKGSRDGVRITQVVQFIPPYPTTPGVWRRRERVLSHLSIHRRGSALEHRDSAYWLRTYSLAQWRACVARGGLVELATYATDGTRMPPHEPGYFWFVLERASV